jgi:uncharacterized membrane protein
MRPISRSFALVALGTVVAGTVLLRLPNVAARSLWYDEASSWQIASFSWPGIIDACRLNVHLPLYYFALKTWMSVFGDSVVALRSMSIFFAALTVVGVYLMAREIFAGSSLQTGSEVYLAGGFISGTAARFGAWQRAQWWLAPSSGWPICRGCKS